MWGLGLHFQVVEISISQIVVHLYKKETKSGIRNQGVIQKSDKIISGILDHNPSMRHPVKSKVSFYSEHYLSSSDNLWYSLATDDIIRSESRHF